MQALDLYASIEEYLDFEDEIHNLYKTIGHIVLSKELKNLIDIGCGQGEFCNIMNLNGLTTYGVDLSKKQIEIALKKDINVQCIDIKDVTSKYDCATATFDVLNYLDASQINTFIQDTYNLLEKGGYFIFDVNSLYGFEEIAQGTLNIDTEDNFIAIDANYEEKILYTDITLFEKVSELYNKTTGTIKQYYHSNNELSQALKSSGFEIEEIIDFNLHSQNEHDKQIFICKKDYNDF